MCKFLHLFCILEHVEKNIIIKTEANISTPLIQICTSSIRIQIKLLPSYISQFRVENIHQNSLIFILIKKYARINLGLANNLALRMIEGGFAIR